MLDLKHDLLLYLAQNGRKKSTLNSYGRLLSILERHCPTFSKEEIQDFLLFCEKNNYRHSYINYFINLLHLINKIHPIPYIPKYYKGQVFVKATMSDEEIEAFLSLPNPESVYTTKKGEKRIRKIDVNGWNKFTMFWKICAYSGMRMKEVACLMIDVVDFGRGVFVLEDTKTTPRFVPIAPNISQELKEYISHLKTDFLFPSRQGGMNGDLPVIDCVDWRENFIRRINILGIKRKNLTAYSLRHSFGTRLLEEDVALFKVMKILGHRRVETTLQYTHMTTKDIQLAVTKHPLIQRSTDPTNIIAATMEDVEKRSIAQDPRFDPEKIRKAIFEFTEALYGSIK